MKNRLVLLALLVVSPVFAQPGKGPAPSAEAVAAKAAGGAYPEISWNDLVPKDWDPARNFRNLNFGSMQDGDPRAMEALELLKREWANAPTDPSFNGRKVRILGYVVPIEEKDRAVTEFLLVPYFGACIHVPPPPANQIIHVISAKPVRNLRVMDYVSVSGEIKVTRYTSATPMGLGVAAYQINSTAVAAYKVPANEATPR